MGSCWGEWKEQQGSPCLQSLTPPLAWLHPEDGNSMVTFYEENNTLVKELRTKVAVMEWRSAEILGSANGEASSWFWRSAKGLIFDVSLDFDGNGSFFSHADRFSRLCATVSLFLKEGESSNQKIRLNLWRICRLRVKENGVWRIKWIRKQGSSHLQRRTN